MELELVHRCHECFLSELLYVSVYFSIISNYHHIDLSELNVSKCEMSLRKVDIFSQYLLSFGSSFIELSSFRDYILPRKFWHFV